MDKNTIDIDLNYSPKILENGDVEPHEILFISDIEHFNSKINKHLFERIKNEKFKAVILLGDNLSGFSTENPLYKIFEQSYTAFEMFYNVKKIMKKYPRKKVDQFDVARLWIGQHVSNKLSEKYSKELKAFKSFVRECRKNNIPIVLFSGNHDSLFSMSNLMMNERFIPVIKEISSLKGLKIPNDFEIIKLKKDLYLMGIHTDEDGMGVHQFSRIKRMLESLDEDIKNPGQIIFVSHIPGIKKFTKLGSPDITNFKKRFKFKYHYHGHCKDYYGEYDEEGIPTKSVHIKDEDKGIQDD